MEEAKQVIAFSRTRGKYGCFSNFYKSPVTYEGLTYTSNEACWQSLKTLDVSEREQFTKLSPSESKKRGRKVQLRKDWEQVKYNLMVETCLAKFNQNEEIKQILLSTGDTELLENTTGWHDNIWGHCSCDRCINKPYRNLLGKALMEVRDKLRNQ